MGSNLEETNLLPRHQISILEASFTATTFFIYVRQHSITQKTAIKFNWKQCTNHVRLFDQPRFLRPTLQQTDMFTKTQYNIEMESISDFYELTLVFQPNKLPTLTVNFLSEKAQQRDTMTLNTKSKLFTSTRKNEGERYEISRSKLRHEQGMQTASSQLVSNRDGYRFDEDDRKFLLAKRKTSRKDESFGGDLHHHGVCQAAEHVKPKRRTMQHRPRVRTIYFGRRFPLCFEQVRQAKEILCPRLANFRLRLRRR